MENYLLKEIKYYVILLFILINFLGCGSISQESVLMQNIEDARMTSAEVAIRINEIGSRYSLTIEENDEAVRVLGALEPYRGSWAHSRGVPG